MRGELIVRDPSTRPGVGVDADEPNRCRVRYLTRKGGLPMASRRTPDSAPEERLEANGRNLASLAAACGEEAGLHKPLNDTVGGVITGIPEEADLAQALSDRETSDILVHLLDENREQVEHALQRVKDG